MAYGHIGVAGPDWWHDEIAKLHRAASDPRWRTREMVVAATQRLLKADRVRMYRSFFEWLSDSDPLVIRAAAAGIAEPPLLTDQERGVATVSIQERAAEWLPKIPPERRNEDAVRVLRQAPGFTISVAVVAAPDAGFGLLEKLATSGDPDIIWVVRENLKKNRLSKWPQRIKAIQDRL